MSRTCAAHGVIKRTPVGHWASVVSLGASPELTRVKQRRGDDGSPGRTADSSQFNVDIRGAGCRRKRHKVFVPGKGSNGPAGAAEND